MEINVDTQWILLDQTSYIGRFGHFLNDMLCKCYTDIRQLPYITCRYAATAAAANTSTTAVIFETIIFLVFSPKLSC